MERRHKAAAFLLAFVLATPLRAQGSADVRSGNRVIEGPTYVPAHGSRTSYLPLRGGERRLSVAASPVFEDDGSAVFRRSLIGSWPVARDVSVGVGLIEITRTSGKDRALSRTKPMQDTEARRDRIAAIGFSFSF